MHAPTPARHELFDVWAPHANAVTLQVESDRIPLIRDEHGGGWWRPSEDERHALSERVASAPDGVDYGFFLDDGELLLPDPRSRRQPNGVHKPSRTFVPANYEWRDERWTGRQLAGGVVMEVHIGTFTPEGTLDSAIERLDHLADLGVTHVELMPVAAFGGDRGWGYDGVGWYAVHEEIGGPEAYQRFVDACHERDLAVIQDVVYNHFGPSGAYWPMFGPYLAPQHATAWGAAVNLDGADSDEVRRFIIDNVRMWIEEYHVDGLRLDAVHALVDTRATHLLEDIANLADEMSAHLGRPITLIAESDLNDPRLIRPREAGGYGLSAQWNDDFHHALHVASTEDRTGYFADFDGVDALAKVIRGGFFHDGSRSSFRGRLHGRPLTPEMQAWRLVVCNQNHDQVGNRADGSRLTDRLTNGQLRCRALVTLTSPFTPMLFMGEEWGTKTPFQFFSSHEEPELAVATSEGRIREFSRMGWDPNAVPDPQDVATFERSKLNWADLDNPEHAEMLELYRSLIQLRRERSALTSPWMNLIHTETDPQARTIGYWRDDILVIVNFGNDEQTIEIDLDRAETPVVEEPELLIATDSGIRFEGSCVVLPPQSGAVIGSQVADRALRGQQAS